MSIISIIKTYAFRFLGLAVIVVLCVPIDAQETTVQPLERSTASGTVTELFGYVSGGPSFSSSLKTATNSGLLYSDKKKLNGGYINFGAAMTLSNTACKWFRFNAAVGYKYQIYSFQNFFTASSGVYSHWLTLDVAPAFGWWGFSFLGVGVMAGLKTDIHLASTMRNNDNFSYEGLYNDCFNPADLCIYGGISYQVSSVKVELCYGGYLIQETNAMKIAYYNLTKPSSNGFYFEFKFYYRIFSTGKL